MTTEIAAPSLYNWTSKPLACPYCLSADLVEITPWSAQSKEDLDNTCEITEYQCQGECEGRSFWV